MEAVQRTRYGVNGGGPGGAGAPLAGLARRLQGWLADAGGGGGAAVRVQPMGPS